MNAKKRYNKTCLCVASNCKCTKKCLYHDCGNCKKTFYKKEGETEFESDDKDGEEKRTVVQINVITHVCIIF